MSIKFEVRITSDDYLDGLPSWCGETIEDAVSYVMTFVVSKMQSGQKAYISKYGMRQNEHLWDYCLSQEVE